jgi:hypothetical protein
MAISVELGWKTVATFARKSGYISPPKAILRRINLCRVLRVDPFKLPDMRAHLKNAEFHGEFCCTKIFVFRTNDKEVMSLFRGVEFQKLTTHATLIFFSFSSSKITGLPGIKWNESYLNLSTVSLPTKEVKGTYDNVVSFNWYSQLKKWRLLPVVNFYPPVPYLCDRNM